MVKLSGAPSPWKSRGGALEKRAGPHRVAGKHPDLAKGDGKVQIVR